ncbi:VOC family protein [Pseudooctadecabacter jejudonensis]|uniref:Glyoxalase-like domain protein n=1 Tax=Pseudooctadecabacter jejudonensis TaxID=1391910 RepID=A0A1Y5SFA1_9RHOB|nr:VOC family protein [Pseudooctadecabacter jejudonensis]SLN39484.1 Glyoxalase-like domain protein [Pseudooctadecabacter jejudonensis]
MADREGDAALGSPVTPYFTVEDADLFLGFIQTVFDAQMVKDDRYADGRVPHARARIGTSLIMVNTANEAYPANVSQMHLRVANVEATLARAVNAGAKVSMAPNTRPHGERMAGVTDPCGNIWWIASPA